jgi:hypothetical protein
VFVGRGIRKLIPSFRFRRSSFEYRVVPPDDIQLPKAFSGPDWTSGLSVFRERHVSSKDSTHGIIFRGSSP